MNQKRRLYRLSTFLTGAVRHGGGWIPCHVLDVTEQGFHVQADVTASIGETLEIRVDLTPSETTQCTVSVTHARRPDLGLCIVAISEADQQRLRTFVEQLITLNLIEP